MNMPRDRKAPVRLDVSLLQNERCGRSAEETLTKGPAKRKKTEEPQTVTKGAKRKKHVTIASQQRPPAESSSQAFKPALTIEEPGEDSEAEEAEMLTPSSRALRSRKAAKPPLTPELSTPRKSTNGLNLGARTLTAMVTAIVSAMPEGADVSHREVRLQLERRMRMAAGSLKAYKAQISEALGAVV
jgi:hypothetical protein